MKFTISSFSVRKVFQNKHTVHTEGLVVSPLCELDPTAILPTVDVTSSRSSYRYTFHFTGTMVHILDNLSSKHCSDLQKLSLICYVPMWQNKSLVDTKKAIKNSNIFQKYT